MSDQDQYPNEEDHHHGHGDHHDHGGFGGRGRRHNRPPPGPPPPPGFWKQFCTQELGDEDLENKHPYHVPSLGRLPPPPKRLNKDEIRQKMNEEEVVAVKPWESDEKEEGVGRVRALLIGINYVGTANELNGCVNDVKQELATFEQVKLPVDEMIILVDDENFPNVTGPPTHANMVKYMAWLVEDAQPGDVMFMHYSGHGAQVASQNDDQEDDDECICPADFDTAGVIIDDDIFDLLAKDLPAGARLTVLFDCCHSGSMMDLPYQFAADSEVTTNEKYHMQQVREGNECEGDVIMISGCADNQTSADVTNASGAGGAATQSLTHILLNNRGLSWQSAMVETREYMKEKGFEQVPQLSASKPIDLADDFTITKTFVEDDEVRQEQQNGDGFYYGGHGGVANFERGPGRGRWGGNFRGQRGRGRGGRGGRGHGHDGEDEPVQEAVQELVAQESYPEDAGQQLDAQESYPEEGQRGFGGAEEEEERGPQRHQGGGGFGGFGRGGGGRGFGPERQPRRRGGRYF